MPINRKYPIEQLLDAVRRFPLKHRQRVTFEYVLLRGVTDSPEDALHLVKLLKGIRAKESAPR
jgi:23S rRNA (adenine2503-C2)-methyltransferase